MSQKKVAGRKKKKAAPRGKTTAAPKRASTPAPALPLVPVRRASSAAFYRRESKAARTARAQRIHQLLLEMYPDAVCELDFQTPFQLLIATILSAQSTDRQVNSITPGLFARFPDAPALAAAEPADVEHLIHSTGFFRQKTKSVIGCSKKLVERHDGLVPPRMEDLVKLNGVGRKTANVVLGVAFNINVGMPVDTHVKRISALLALTTHTDPEKIEPDLLALIPQDSWRDFSLRIIWHGRRVCMARNPDCEHCQLAPLCPSRRVD